MSMSMDGEEMVMSFNSQNTPLYSKDWTPSGPAAYAGTCIFLIILAIIYRSLFALKAILEARWADAARSRRYVVVADKQPVSEHALRNTDLKEGILTANGLDERIKVLDTPVRSVQPWRLSVDVPRAFLVTMIACGGYLLMLAVMTMNAGYFLSVLAGTLVGELAVGRYIQAMDDH